MKKLLIITISLVTFQLYTQHPDLLEREWFVQYVVIDGVQYDVPDLPFDGVLYFWEVPQIGVYHNYCEEGFDAAILNFEGTNQFTFEDGGVVLLGVCGSQNLNEFMQMHYELYWLDNYFARNPCTYTIAEDANGLNLVVTNNIGDVGVYGDYQLSSDDFQQVDVSIYPNPTSNLLAIQNQNGLDIESVVLYDTLGRKVMENNEATESLDVSNLTAGVYFIHIATDSGMVTKKIIKE